MNAPSDRRHRLRSENASRASYGKPRSALTAPAIGAQAVAAAAGARVCR